MYLGYCLCAQLPCGSDSAVKQSLDPGLSGCDRLDTGKMDKGRECIQRGDECFVRGEYTTALGQFKQAFSLSVDEESRNNAVSNGLAAEAKLGLSSQTSFSFGSLLCQAERSILQPSSRQSPQTQNAVDDSKSQPSVALFKATLDVDKDNWNPDSFLSRAKLYYRLGDYASAMHDLETVDALDPHGDVQWEWIAECAIASNQDDVLADAIRQGQRRGVDMFLYQCIHALKTRRLRELYALCQKITLPCNPRLLEVRMNMNIEFGNYRMAWTDAVRLENVEFPWLMFFQDRLPGEWDFKKYNQGPYLALVRDGFFRSFEDGTIYDTPFDLGIDQCSQAAWVSGNGQAPRECGSARCHYPPDFEFELDEKRFSPSLLKDAISYGKLVLSDSKDKRKLACVGFAMLELAQLFDDYLTSGEGPIPSLSLILSICMNWMRLADPSKPVFLSGSYKDNIIYLEEDGHPTDRHEFLATVFSCFRENFPVPGLINWEGVSGPDELLRRKPIHSEVKVPGSPARIFASLSRNNRANFGIVWLSSDCTAPLCSMLSRIFLNVKRWDANLCFRDALIFVFEWMRWKPITSFSQEIGLCIFVALLHSTIRLELGEPLPAPARIELWALFSKSFENFAENIKEEFQIQVVKSLKISCLPRIVEVMPNWHLRIQALRLIEEGGPRS